MNPKYLFIRILEACNADCFMCEFALSKDSYRMSVADFTETVVQAQATGVELVRFSGGEPLMHPDVVAFVTVAHDLGIKTSTITNGWLLERKAAELVAAGLDSVVVSIDGAAPDTHDLFRRTAGLFDRAIAGVRECLALGLRVRVNTVVGPHNYQEIPRLSKELTGLGVQEWEVQAIKLERAVGYPDPATVLATCEPVYAQHLEGHLTPLMVGKRFYGDTADEQAQFFQHGMLPRAAGPICHLTDDVMYIDGKNGRVYSCNCLPHRPGASEDGGELFDQQGRLQLISPGLIRHRDYFREHGPSECTGCSPTAAGYSNAITTSGRPPEWSY